MPDVIHRDGQRSMLLPPNRSRNRMLACWALESNSPQRVEVNVFRISCACLTKRFQHNCQAMKKVETGNKLSTKEREALLDTLQTRFQKNMNRHKGVDWVKVKTKLEANAAKLWSVHLM